MTDIVEELKDMCPYPEDIFTEPTKEQMTKVCELLLDHDLSPDKFFGNWARIVWKNCCRQLELLLESNDEIFVATEEYPDESFKIEHVFKRAKEMKSEKEQGVNPEYRFFKEI